MMHILNQMLKKYLKKNQTFKKRESPFYMSLFQIA